MKVCKLGLRHTNTGIAHRMIPLSLPCRNRKNEGTLSKLNRENLCVSGKSYLTL